MSFNYKPFVEILPEKANAWRNYCICIACKDANSRDNALLKKFSYKTERIRTHLKKCQHFKNKYFEIYAELFEVETISGENNDINNPNKRLRKESTGSVKNKKIQELFYFLNPALTKLPGRKAIRRRILDDESKILENEMIQKLKDDPVGITLSFDTIDINGDFERWKEIVEKTEAIFEEINKMGVKLIAVVIDSALSYAATRWNSYYECFCTLIKSKEALRTLGSKFEPPEQSTSCQPNDPLYLPANISFILLDETWWQSLSELVKLLKPYCIILDILQCDKVQLYEVLHGFGYFVQFWKEYDDLELDIKMIDHLKTRWKS
ncbi:ribonuclease H-like domain-containing protein [Rhizophagus clarus]|uniref:Ribonuclease H-like domain-containing protein n=1 Tax=Rhizophagus clarus TaxID=94130 RepID=A0A8H3LU81_9GLOM|nr:ribonuclease H-like domain-containing protein [Rhizophagus clarus]